MGRMANQAGQKKRSYHRGTTLIFFPCSPSWTRTKDPLINSQML